ncbi:hypothetical protein HDF16_002121 [Granulicella aggregans]|uniref:IPT/TIG domain-containing protein n=1 Tax=Granulicella aggregans TaxID=474949 RepID=A0A7W7ZCJ2_9BACT|nr:hypothetical protein [Granulicella aggregans]MBB5057415.1 hypothetical protein [Granulicella aggregans]
MRRVNQCLAALFSMFAVSAALGQGVNNCTDGTKDDAKNWKLVPCNGLSVGLPKAFDNRTLTLQLQKLKQQLSQQQTQNGVFDFKSVAAALNNLQGLSQRETSTAVSVTASPTPATSLTNTLNTGIVDANGNPLPNTTTTQNQVTNSSVTPAAPAFDSFAALPAGFSPTFGSSPSDLLNDQMDLSYQIVNLQLLLDRALSDRIYPHSADGQTRLQTVLGFNVTLDPPRTANDAVAVVEVALDVDDVSLVALMPQEKTYNAAALSSKSNAYSGAAMAGAFQVGGGLRKRSQVFYLYKDVDTLSYERMAPGGKIVFGWMFRPVLGRRSVTPGLKQLFAVLALPKKDCTAAVADDSCSITLTPKIRTYWKKYDRNTQTAFEEREANRARDFMYGLSFGLAKPQLFAHAGYLNYRAVGSVRIGSTDEYQQQLTPTVTNIEWRPTGSKTATISVKGNNFFTDTQVLLGDNHYSESAGNMAIKSDQSFELASTLDQVASGTGVIQGRYGLSAPLVNTGPANCREQCEYGVEIDGSVQPKLTESLSGTRRLTITLRGKPDPKVLLTKSKDDEKSAYKKQSWKLAVSNLGVVTNGSLTAKSGAATTYATQTPILSVNGTAVPFPYDIVPILVGGEERVQISADVSDTLLNDTSAATIKIAWPFYDPERWSSTIPYTPIDAQFTVARVSDNTFVLARINGTAIVGSTDTKDHCWTLIASDKPLRFGTPDCTPKPPAPAPAKAGRKPVKKPAEAEQPTVTPLPSRDKSIASFVFTLPTKLPSKALLVSTDAGIYHLTIPDVADKKDTAVKVTTLQQYDSTWIDITYPAAKVPVRVETNGVALKWRIDPPDPKAKPDTAAAKKADKTLHVEITRAQTAKPGLLDLIVFGKDDAQIVKQQIKVTCTLCGDGGDK